jgi:two-component system sensor histidine kinase UhpB
MKRKILFVFFISLTGILFSQSTKIDSLKNVLSKQASDTNRVNTLNKLGFEFVFLGQYNNALPYIKEASTLSRKLKFDRGLAASLNGLGVISKNKGDNKTALIFFLEAMDIAERINYTSMIGSLSNNMGRLYSNLGDYPKTLEYFYKAFRIQRSLGDKSKMANVLRGIGNVYMLQHDKKALYCFFESLRLYKEAKVNDGIAGSLNDIGEYYAKEKNLRMALKYYYLSLEASKAASYETERASSENNLGLVYSTQGNFNGANEHFLRSLELYKKLNNIEEQSAVYYNLGELYFNNGDFSYALDNYKNSLDKANLSGVLQRKKDAHDGLSKVYEKLGNADKAYIHFKEYVKVKENIFNDENTRKLVRAELNYELEMKEQEIKFEQSRNQSKLKQGRIQTYFLLLSIAFLLLLGLFLFQRLSLKQKLKVSGIRNKIAIDLHDEVGSALSSISMYAGITQMNKDSEANTEIIDKIGKTSRETIENMSDIVWSIQPKNDNFKLVLDKMENFGNHIMGGAGIQFKLSYAAGIENLNLDMEQRKNLYLIYKEGLNNAAKYSGAANVHAEIERKRKNIVMTITDDGKGFDPLIQKKGNGLLNMEERSRVINGSFAFISKPGYGTKLSVTFKVG